MTQALRVAWYRFRVGFRRRWPGYLSIVLLIGSVGGVAMASIAGARRRDSSFHQFLESTNPSDLALVTGLYHPDPTGYDPGFIKKIAHLPHVTRVESQAGYSSDEVGPKGYPVPSAVGGSAVNLNSSIDGQFFNMDRLAVLSGRRPNPKDAHEVAVTAVAALGLTLIASVRRRRRDLALLKALGFTQRQLAAAVAWQATVAAVIGLIIGVPVGVFIGRELWILFARSIYVVPEPTVPVLSVVLVGVGALVFANLVALVPGRSAARTSAALVLRAE